MAVNFNRKSRKELTMDDRRAILVDKYWFQMRLLDRFSGVKVSIWDYEDLCKFYHMWS